MAEPTERKEEVAIAKEAGKAFRAARLRALRAGQVVLVVEKGKLVRILPNRERVEVRAIGKPRSAPPRLVKGVMTAITWKKSQV